MYNLTVSDEQSAMSIESHQRLERLIDLTRALSAARDVEAYLQMLISAAVELTGSETASILEYDGEAAVLRFRAVPWFHSDALTPLSVPLNSSAAGWVVRTAAPLIIADVSKDERHFRDVDAVSNFKTRSLLAVPLKLNGKILGAFEALNKADDVHYTEDDVAILETLASLAVTLMQKIDLEQRVKDSYEEVAELDRMKGEFIAITSHELRTPLGLILGHATFLREMLNGQYDEQMETIIRSATRLKEIIESLSSVDNYQTGLARIRQRQVSMTRIIEEVESSFREVARQKNISLRTEISGDDLLIDGDPNKISIALSNLVKNAITFTDQGGQILITAESVTGHIKVSVIDNGIGIPPSDLPRIFERFFQVESHLTRRHGGMGLGLSVAKAMIEMHGGRIHAESVAGRGSNFTFLLPVHPQQPRPLSQTAAE
ncbi:MAG: GAF domain-containing sensor histidine kinase [Chloroflexi bacterium]|nr:GAF domain-containing sensor histidine kinase [Chloroflexota bacterium]